MGLSQIPSQIKSLFGAMSPAKRISFVILLTVTVAILATLIMWAKRPEFQVLYSNLSLEDSGSIVERLKEQKVPYKVSGGGSTISIPQDHVYDVRLDMASKGIPQGGSVGFELFDNTKLGMTEFVQNVNYQRALQGELARTISRFSEVESARVHVVLPPKSLFIEEETPATASVVLKLRSGKWLSRDQIQGVVYLISSSVQGLEAEKVTIVDDQGKLLAGLKDEESGSKVSNDQMEYRQKMEKSTEDRIKSMLEAVLGPDKAIVRVACQLDFTRHEKTEETFLPQNKVVRSEQLFNENSSGTITLPAGVPGLASNLQGAKKADAESTSTPTYQKQDKTTNYEIGKVTSRKVMPIGSLTRISAAVVIDGSYKSSTNDEGEVIRTYIPRTPEEMEKFGNIVKRTISYDPDRGDEVEVANIAFEGVKEKGDEFTQVSDWRTNLKQYMPFIRYGFLGLFALFTFLFIIRPLVHWLTAGGAGEGEMLKQLPKTVGELEQEYADGEIPFRQKVSQLIIQESSAPSQVMREWIKET